MTSTAVPLSGVDDLSAAGLLVAAAEHRRAADAHEAALLVVAAQWADLHPPESLGGAASFVVAGSEHEEPVAGQGCPAVAEFCLAELGCVLGMSTVAAKRLVGQALELRHRLPRLWGRVQAGQVPAWRARRVAEATIHAHPALEPDAARWVDGQVAPFAERIGVAQLDRTVAEAVRRQQGLLPDDPEDEDPPCPDPRHVRVDDQNLSWAGTVRVEAELDLADALDLDHTLGQRAAVLKALGSTESLDARRARALGELARRQTSLNLATGAAATGPAGSDPAAATGTGEGSTPDAAGPAARELVLHLHFSAAATGGPDGAVGLSFDALGRLEEGQRLLLLDQVRSWCGASDTRVTLKPVIDLNAEITGAGYPVPDRLRERVTLRDRTCTFPWCGRPARGCDVDHVIAFDHDAHAAGAPQPGPTATWNLAALCRRHHRVKTFGGWRVTMPAPGVVEWTSPHGHRYRRDPAGTTRIEPPEPR